MKTPLLKNQIGKACFLLAAALMLPVLSYADTDHGKGNDRDSGRDKGDPDVAPAPEFNTGIVLIPFVGGVLVFSSLQLLRRRKKASV